LFKKIKYISFGVIFLLTSFSFTQQELFIPRNINVAYEKGTRSYNGKPGPEYWQNSSNYKIKVEVDPITHHIIGSEVITYYNNSPDTLKRIVLRLYPNVFRKGSARDYAMVSEGVNEGVTIETLIVNADTIDFENQSSFSVNNTVAIIYLKNHIPPDSESELMIDWNFEISDKVTWRIGMYDSTTGFVGYWFPQIAVYDDIDGWDYNNYSGQVEFYNDFSNFNVSITIPNNYGVWATGELQNPEEVFDQRILEKYHSAKESSSVVRIIATDDYETSLIYKSDKEKNTWIYKASDVTDFAFAFSDHYLWDGLMTTAAGSNNDGVFVQSIYPVDSPDFTDITKASKEIIKYFSNEMPGISFPFPSMILFNNGRSGGGMEFPMMVNNGSASVWENSVALAAHEIAHQYFPFYVGTNERKYAFMDEAWAVMLPFNYMEEFAGINLRLLNTVASYEYIAGTEDDIPPMVITLSLDYSSYRNAAYNRPSIAYEILNDMLGEEIFLQALQEFIYSWAGKHPTPYDFFFTFNEVTGQDLTWYWKPWFFEYGYPDLAIENVEVENSKANISIRKVGIIPTPIKFIIYYENGSEDEIYYSVDVWKEGNDFYKMEVELSDILKEIRLGDSTIPDSNRENNYYLVH
jgi:hypothetical protein